MTSRNRPNESARTAPVVRDPAWALWGAHGILCAFRPSLSLRHSADLHVAESALNASRSEFLRIRGLRYHLRRWGDPAAPQLFLLHGFLDVSASFQYLVEGLLPQFQVIAPDWRGFGHTQWPAREGTYWFQDYVGDLQVIVEHYSPEQPILLVGHSLGAQVASLYAGLQPKKVRKLVLLDGLFMRDMPLSMLLKRYRTWLHRLDSDRAIRPYASFEELAQRIRRNHPGLSEDRALFVAHCWARQDAAGGITLCADPRHYHDSPGLYRLLESQTIWREVAAPTLLIDATRSFLAERDGNADRQEVLNCFADHRHEIIEGAGHMLHFDAPEQAATLIKDFLLS